MAFVLFDPLSDPNGNLITIKAGSTSVASTDTALVVGLSPNTALPTGSNVIGAVTQSSGPWTMNITQVGGNAVSTGANGLMLIAIEGHAGGALDAAGQNAASPANQLLVGGQFNTTPTTISSGNMSPLQLDSGGSLKVNINAQSLPELQVTLSQIAGTPTITAGVAGLLAVGGAAAAGSAVSGNPVLVGGTDGTDARFMMTDSLGVQVKESIAWAATNGRISGALSGYTFGFSPSGAVGAIYGTAYTQPTSAGSISFKSSSTNDASAGTGARTITVYGYTSAMAQVSETITMNGTTAVNSVNTTYQFIEKFVVAGAGSLGANAGTITCYVGTGGTGTAIGTIGYGVNNAGQGDNTTLWAHHYVRAGKTCYVLSFDWSLEGASTGSVALVASNPTATAPAEVQISSQFGTRYVTGAFTFPVPLVVAGPARIRVYSNTAGVETNAGFMWVEF